MAYINVDEVYILDNTGAQVDAVTDIPFKADAGLTDAQKAQARANLGISESGGVNRNLLDNGWFRVNQRGWTSGNMGALVYWADRWMNNTDTTNPSTLSLNNGIVTITTPSGTGRFGNILQTLADPNAIDGKVVTLSALKSDGTIISGTATRVNGTTQDLYSAYGITLRLTGTNRASLQVDNGASISIKAMKLELGTTSTLANDVPPDYGEELRKCQWYFKRIKSAMSYAPVGYGFQTSSVVCNMKIAGSMRVAPTPTFSGTLRLVGNTSASIDVTSLSAGQTDAEGVVIKANTAGSLSANHAYTMYLTTGSYIDLSADL